MTNPETVVQKQLDAYNAKDLNAWLATYDKDAIQYSMEGDILASGHDEIAQNMRVRFAEPDLFSELLNRMVCDELVIDHELITRNFSEGKGSVEMLCIYQVANGLITSGKFKIFNKVIFES